MNRFLCMHFNLFTLNPEFIYHKSWKSWTRTLEYQLLFVELFEWKNVLEQSYVSCSYRTHVFQTVIFFWNRVFGLDYFVRVIILWYCDPSSVCLDVYFLFQIIFQVLTYFLHSRCSTRFHTSLVDSQFFNNGVRHEINSMHLCESFSNFTNLEFFMTFSGIIKSDMADHFWSFCLFFLQYIFPLSCLTSSEFHCSRFRKKVIFSRITNYFRVIFHKELWQVFSLNLSYTSWSKNLFKFSVSFITSTRKTENNQLRIFGSEGISKIIRLALCYKDDNLEGDPAWRKLSRAQRKKLYVSFVFTWAISVFSSELFIYKNGKGAFSRR